jgi:DNA-binding transcriptional regulator YdaS (Cro superfamily)
MAAASTIASNRPATISSLTEQVTTEELRPVHIEDFDPENLASSDTRP